LIYKNNNYFINLIHSIKILINQLKLKNTFEIVLIYIVCNKTNFNKNIKFIIRLAITILRIFKISSRFKLKFVCFLTLKGRVKRKTQE